MKSVLKNLLFACCILTSLYFVGCSVKEVETNQNLSKIEKQGIQTKPKTLYKKLISSQNSERKVDWYLINKKLSDEQIVEISKEIIKEGETGQIYLVDDERTFESYSKQSKIKGVLGGMPHEYIRKYLVAYLEKTSDGKYGVFRGTNLYASQRERLAKISVQ